MHVYMQACMCYFTYVYILFIQSYYNTLVLCFLFVHYTNLHLQGSPQNAVCPLVILREPGHMDLPSD